MSMISIIVPTFNRAHWLEEALGSLLSQKTDGRFSYEIVVVDNNSTDNTAEVAHRVSKTACWPVRYVFQPQPGDAPARNAGLQSAAGEWLAFFDDDQLADATWLSTLFAAAHRYQAKIVGGPVHLLLSPNELKWCGTLLRRQLRETRLYDTDRPYDDHHLPGTGNVLVARSVVEDVGPFNEEMVEGGSDFEFFDRARQKGYAIWYAADAVVYHRVPAERLTPAYLRWDSLSGGACQATQRDLPDRGLAAVWVLALARLVKAVGYHVPAAFICRMLGRPGHALGHWTIIWRAEGYLRQTLALLCPRLFPQKDFFASLEFRKGHAIARAARAAIESASTLTRESLLPAVNDVHCLSQQPIIPTNNSRCGDTRTGNAGQLKADP